MSLCFLFFFCLVFLGGCKGGGLKDCGREVENFWGWWD